VAAEAGPEGALNVNASVVLGRIAGAPQPVLDRMVRMLDAASRRADMALLNYNGAQGDYRLQGDLIADLQGNKVRLSYRWQVLDKAGAELGRIAGALMLSGGAADPWGGISDTALQTIAEKGIAMVARQGKGIPPAASAPVPLAQSAPSVARQTAPMAPSPAQMAPSPAALPASPEQEMAIDTSEALQLVNDYRRSKGLLPLALNHKLARAAAALAADMAKHNRISHTGPNGADLTMRLKFVGYRFGLAAENVGAGQSTLAELIESWKNDPSQSRNLLVPDATQMGISYRYRPDTNYKTYWALVVAAP
jgi:uncharacterized protein YkwD